MVLCGLQVMGESPFRRHLFSPTEELDCAASVTSSHQSEEFVSVKDKIKIIAAQQEEIVRREESKTTKRKEHAPPAGGIRILPPSPTTVRKVRSYLQNLANLEPLIGVVFRGMKCTKKVAWSGKFSSM